MANIFNSTVTPGLLALSEDRDTIDYLKDVRTQLRDTMKANYEPNKLNQQSEFNAVCLRQLSNSTIENKNIVRIIARVPELHNLLPIPQDENDLLAISLYPTYIGQSADLANGSISDNTILPGTRIVVKYENLTNFTDPKIVRLTNIVDSRGGRFTSTSPRSTGQRRSAPVTPGTIQAYTTGLKTSTGATARYGDNKPYEYYTKMDGGGFDPRAAYPLRANQVRYVGFRRYETRTPHGVVLHSAGHGSAPAPNILPRDLMGRPKTSLGTHYEVRPDGKIIEYEDPKYKLTHAGSFNPMYIGIDLVGVSPGNSPGGTGKTRFLKQLEATWVLINKLAKEYNFPLQVIAEKIPGTNQWNIPLKKYPLGGDDTRAGRKAVTDFKGVHSHEELGHLDGNYAKVYMAYRMIGYTSENAYIAVNTTFNAFNASNKEQKNVVGFLPKRPAGATQNLNWKNGKPIKMIPVGIISRETANKHFGAGPDIVEMNNYTGKAYTKGELDAIIAEEKANNWQPNISPSPITT
jgi:hypothetical protein